MKTLPVTVAALVLGEHAAALAPCGRRLGARVELDLASAREVVGDETVGRLEAYWDAAREYWAGGAHGGVVVRRRIVSARQRDGRDGKVDLARELDALDEIGLDAACDALLGTAPDVDALAGIGGIAVVEQGESRTVVTATLSSPVWPDALGGVPGVGEVAREVTLVAAHAKWRDRRVRRLVAVEVVSVELWPDPAPYTSA
jgi:hypothetical protein